MKISLRNSVHSMVHPLYLITIQITVTLFLLCAGLHNSILQLQQRCFYTFLLLCKSDQSELYMSVRLLEVQSNIAIYKDRTLVIFIVMKVNFLHLFDYSRTALCRYKYMFVSQVNVKWKTHDIVDHLIMYHTLEKSKNSTLYIPYFLIVNIIYLDKNNFLFFSWLKAFLF